MSATGAAPLRWRDRLVAWAERCLPALTRLRHAEKLPIELHRRRIYVLPTGFGVALAILLSIMLLGALNYSNNPALLLTCVLAAAAWMSLFAGFRTLVGLELLAVNASDCHAGDPLELVCTFAAEKRQRPSLRLRWNGVDVAFALHAKASSMSLRLPTERRGWLVPGRLKLWTEQPLGLFIIWSWLNPEVSLLVYPAIEHPAPPLPMIGGLQGQRFAPGRGDEYSGLRAYRAGDPPRHIAWKASARHDSLLVRESELTVGDDLQFDYNSLAGLDHEARIRRLAAWVVVAEAAMRSYRLVTTTQSIGPGLGSQHRHACLRALALLPHAPD